MTFSLTVGVNTVSLSNLSRTPPLRDKNLGTIKHTTISGVLLVRDLYEKLYHELTVNNVSKANADLVNGWREDGETISYTPNTAVPAEVYLVKIVNESHPLQWMADISADTKFEGTIMLREV